MNLLDQEEDFVGSLLLFGVEQVNILLQVGNDLEEWQEDRRPLELSAEESI